MLLVLALAAAASCSRDTTPQPRTLFSSLPIKALHFDEGGGTGPTVGQTQAQMMEFRISLAICRLPSYTLGVVAQEYDRGGSTGTTIIEGTPYARYLRV